MAVGSLFGTSSTGLCLKSKHPRLRLSRQVKPAETAGRFLVVQGRVPLGTWSVNGTPVLPPAAHLRSTTNFPCDRTTHLSSPAAVFSA